MPARRRRVYRFGNSEFTSRESARVFFSEMRARYADAETIDNATDLQAVSDLLQGHCQRAEKIGCGVKRFFVAPAPDHPNTRCFWIERIDGSRSDFGFNACVDGIGMLNRQDLRRLIRPQIYEFKDGRVSSGDAEFTSDFSGITAPVSEAHVDHVTGFEEIVTAFAEREGIDIESELLTVPCDARSEPTWKTPALAARFVEFHAQFELRLVTANENLSALRRSVAKNQNQP